LAAYFGFYKNEGLNVEIVKVESEKEALVTGKIDAAGGFMASWLPAISNGVEFAFTTGIHTGCGSVVVLADSGIKTFADRKGKTIAVSGGFGSGVHNYGMRAVIHEGLHPKDFNWINFDASLGLDVLKKGHADILVGADQMLQRWIKSGSVVRIHSNTFDADFRDEPCCVFGISNDFIAKNPVSAQKLTRAVYRAALWLDANDKNKYEACRYLRENNFINVDDDYAVELMKMWKFGVSNEQCEICLDNSIIEYVKAGIIGSNVDIANLRKISWHSYDMSDIEKASF
ncbi:MAG: ABC transporter substrate-binding protein, partial [Spirochaetales bacterium]|jgi:NitT/TauT family transport system substrate-binding protein|nr:ABC transporter substrate-binding protein [Spirochaetales bacterium]